MALARIWTDPRNGKLWLLKRGLRVGLNAVLLIFICGAERYSVFADRRADPDSLMDEELEALLDQAQMVH